MTTTKLIKLDANYNKAISSCADCSSHEDAKTPPICLVCNDCEIDGSKWVHNFPLWCPLMTMAIYCTDISERMPCILCGGITKLVKDGDQIKYGACRKCGVRYYLIREY